MYFELCVNLCLSHFNSYSLDNDKGDNYKIDPSPLGRFEANEIMREKNTWLFTIITVAEK